MPSVTYAVGVDRTATRDEVLSERGFLVRLGEQHGLGELRVLVDGTIVAHVAEESYGPIKRFASAAAERLGAWVNVIRDDVPGAEGPAEPL